MIGRPDTFSYNSKDYDLRHTFSKTYVAVSEGRPDGINVVCNISCHCFTSSYCPDGAIPPDYITEGENRWFCPNRWELSKTLHAHFENALLNAARFKVFWSNDRTGSKNLLTVRNPDDGQSYCIYFDVSVQGNGANRYLLLQVRSAYLQSVNLSGRDKVRLGTVIDQILGIRQKGNRKNKRKK